MKIISSKQSKALDLATLQREPISSLDLMERAGRKLFEIIFNQFGTTKKYCILCGNGNNGGDGLVIARLLWAKFCDVSVFIDQDSSTKSPENLENLSKLRKTGVLLKNFSTLKSPEHENIVWVDALFGVGLNRPLDGKWATIVEKINAYKGIKIAIDIPSGLFSDKINTEKDLVFEADETYSIGQPKLSFFLPETGKFTPKFQNVNIGLSKSFLQELQTSYHYTDFNEIKSIYKPRKRFSHKGTYGHALIIGGSYGKMGAAVLATQASLKSGAGLVSSYNPQCGYEIMQISAPEAMSLTNENHKTICSFPSVKEFNSIGIGPGLGTQPQTREAFLKALKTGIFQHKKLVLDADALNLLSFEKESLNLLPPATILTPHPKEFERLTHSTANSLERLNLAITIAKKHHVVLVLKDAYTAVISPTGEVFFNSTGNAALATGGSGDVLTGIITGLLAQNYSAIEAAKLGVWLHGKSADLGLHKESMESFTATAILKNLGVAFNSLSNA